MDFQTTQDHPNLNHSINDNNLYHNMINKKYKSCGCIIISELDILENIIQDKYLQICKDHYKHNNKINNNIKYSYDKHSNKYIYNPTINKENNQKNLYKSKSYENLYNIIYNNTKNIKNSNTLVNFGKYKNKTYEYVYYNDKLYCYNLAFWNNKNYTNQNIQNFIQYIKNQLLMESN